MSRSSIIYYLLGSLLLLQSCQNFTDNKVELMTLDSDVSESDFQIHLESEKSIYKLGENLTIEVKIINKSGKTMNFLTSLDGSSEKMRFPHTGFIITRNDTILKSKTLFRCGNMDGISQECKVTLKDKQFFNPQSVAPWVYRDRTLEDSTIFSKAGIYDIIYYYSTEQDTLSEWLGWNVDISLHSLEKKAQDSLIKVYRNFFKLVPRIDITSEPLKIEIKNDI